MSDLERRINELQAKQDAAAREEIRKAIRRTVASGSAPLRFRDGRSRMDFNELISGRVQVNDEGELAGPDGLALDEFMKQEYTQRAWLRPSNDLKSNSGRESTVPTFDLDEWDRCNGNLSPEAMDRMEKAIVAALPQSSKGRH